VKSPFLSLLPTLLLGACSSSPPSLAVLISPAANSAPPETLEVRVYDDFKLLGSKSLAQPSLPGVVHVTALPPAAEQLRVVVVAYDATRTISALAATRVRTPLSASELPLTLGTTFDDADHDGVPDVDDDCPMVADVGQDDSRGFGNGPGSACTAGPLPDMAGGCPSGAFCDSFDESALDSTTWILPGATSDGSSVGIDTTRAYRGPSSLHAHLEKVPHTEFHSAFIREQKTFPSGHFYVRAFVFAPSAFTADAGAFMQAEQAVAPMKALSLQLENGGFSMFDALHTTPPSAASAGAAKRDQWICVEWEIKIAADGGAHLSIDGVPAGAKPDIAGDLSSSPALGELAFGLGTYAGGDGDVPARDLWLDELVVSPTPVGCQ
jgi:hypothetical protein